MTIKERVLKKLHKTSLAHDEDYSFLIQETIKECEKDREELIKFWQDKHSRDMEKTRKECRMKTLTIHKENCDDCMEGEDCDVREEIVEELK